MPSPACKKKPSRSTRPMWKSTSAISPRTRICLVLFCDPVVAAPGVLNRRPVADRPGAERADRVEQRLAELGQFIIDARWIGRQHRARNQSVAFERAQREGEHALRDAAQRLAQFVEAL